MYALFTEFISSWVPTSRLHDSLTKIKQITLVYLFKTICKAISEQNPSRLSDETKVQNGHDIREARHHHKMPLSWLAYVYQLLSTKFLP